MLARGACLITPKIDEIPCNEIYTGQLLCLFGNNAPLNVTSMLEFRNATK